MTETLSLKAGGMTCSGCSSSLHKALTETDGVTSASVSHKDGNVSVTYDPARTSPEALRLVIEDTGFDVL